MVVHRVRSPDEAVFCGELDALAVSRGLRTPSWCPAPGGQFLGSGRLPRRRRGLPRHLVPNIAERDVFVCGPDAWMDAALGAARQAGVPADRLHAERFA